MRRLPSVLVLVSLLAANAAQAGQPLPQVAAWLAAGGPKPPPQSACPAVANLDLKKIDAALAPYRPKPGEGLVELPAAAEALIPADARVVVRAYLPPGGLYNSEIKAVIWKAADGRWMFWSQHKNFSDPPPMPPLPPLPGSPEEKDWKPPPPMTDDTRWPPVSGELKPERAQQLDAALSDPCRAWDPDFFPLKQPLLRRDPEWGRERMCPPDGGAYFADITEPGRPRRPIGASCINDTPTFRLISAAAYAG